MYQLGNLAIVCARKGNMDLRVCNGKVTVHFGRASRRPVFKARWNDNRKIMKFIYHINHGKDRKENDK